MLAIGFSAFTAKQSRNAKENGFENLYWFVAPYNKCDDFMAVTVTVSERIFDLPYCSGGQFECERAYLESQLRNGSPTQGVLPSQVDVPAAVISHCY